MSGYKPDHWDAVRTGEREEEDSRPLPTMESIYRGKCASGVLCLHGCHRNERCYSMRYADQAANELPIGHFQARHHSVDTGEADEYRDANSGANEDQRG